MRFLPPSCRPVFYAALLIAVSPPPLSIAQQAASSSSFPFPEKLTYRVEWRSITAGTTTIQLSKSPTTHGWDFDLNIESAGLVSRLYRVFDKYRVSTNDQFCAINANLDAQEGKKHTVTKLIFNSSTKKLAYDEHDFVKNTSEAKSLDVDACTYEISGALASLRMTRLDPGKSITVPISDGKKFVRARIEAQARETLTVNGKSYQTMRYEAFLFDNVLYKKRGRLLMWIAEDGDRLPVQIRVLMGFPIGTISVELQGHERF